jgi:hypothetical protein
LLQNFFKNNETNSICFVLVSIEKSGKVTEDSTTTKQLSKVSRRFRTKFEISEVVESFKSFRYSSSRKL